MLDHSVGIYAEAGLPLRRRFEAGPDMHPTRIEPGKERLLLIVRTVDEVERRLEELLVHRFHALFVERPVFLTFLLPPLPEPWFSPGGLSRGRITPQHPARTEAQ